MSWRTLLVFLLLAAVASWQGGIQLGEWLVSRAPESIASAASPKDTKDKVLDANGKAFTPQPPQPRIDGTLGVPRSSAPVEWTITPILASVSDEGTTAMEVDSEGNYEKRDHELAAGGAGLAQPQSDVATLDIATAVVKTAPPAAQSRATPASPAAPPMDGARTSANTDPTKAPVITVYSWTQTLKKEIEQCASLGFFQRPTCVQNARNKFCAPNNAWGRITDCPARD